MKKKCGAIVIVVIIVVIVVVVVVVEVGHAHLISLSLWVDKRSTSFLWFGLPKEGPSGLRVGVPARLRHLWSWWYEMFGGYVYPSGRGFRTAPRFTSAGGGSVFAM